MDEVRKSESDSPILSLLFYSGLVYFIDGDLELNSPAYIIGAVSCVIVNTIITSILIRKASKVRKGAE